MQQSIPRFCKASTIFHNIMNGENNAMIFSEQEKMFMIISFDYGLRISCRWSLF